MDPIQAHRKIVELCNDNNIADALSLSKELLEYEPNDKGASLLIAELYPYPDFYGEKMQRSVNLHKQLVEKYPNSQSLKIKLAESLRNNENYEHARELYKQILEEDPFSYDAVLGINMIHLLPAIDFPEDEILHYLEYSLILEPFRYEGYRDTAFYFYRRGKLDEARNYYNRAMKLLANNKSPREMIEDSLRAIN